MTVVSSPGCGASGAGTGIGLGVNAAVPSGSISRRTENSSWSLSAHLGRSHDDLLSGRPAALLHLATLHGHRYHGGRCCARTSPRMLSQWSPEG
jgi:hypothetical protein